MSKGGGMPDPAAWAGRAQAEDTDPKRLQCTIDDVYKLARSQVEIWLSRVDGARDAKLKSDLLTAREEHDLRAASADLHLSWKQFSGYADFLMVRLGDDELAKMPLVALMAEYLRGVGAAGAVSKLSGLPTRSDHRIIDKFKSWIRRQGRVKKRAFRQEIFRSHVHKADDDAGASGPDLRVLLGDLTKALREVGTKLPSDKTLGRDIDAIRKSRHGSHLPR